MKCIVLCAGYGVRLYPLTKDKPKPLLPVGGRPLLERILERILEVPEIDSIYIVSNHRFVSHFYYWLRDYQAAHKPKAKIDIFDDMTMSNDDRLGAIGDMQFVIQNGKIDDDLLVVAGDNLLMFDVREFVAFGRSKGAAIAVKDVKTRQLAKLYGVVTLDQEGRVTDFEEKPPSPTSTLISIGLYFFGKKHVGLVKQYIDEGHNQDQPGNYISWLHQQIPVYSCTIKGQWFDIGNIDQYNQANEAFGE
jgi:glucose-1-phosphate thymidylyltransferase